MLVNYALPLACAASLAAAGYAPTRGACPVNATLIRSATGGVNPDEAAWAAQRYQTASTALAAWLAKIDPTFPVLAEGQYPTLALSDGGGGLRGWSISAGVHKAFDGDEPDAANYSTSGLYQAFTYEAGLSGSAVMLYSYVQNNWPLTSSLLKNLWVPAFAKGVATTPPGLGTVGVVAQQMSKSTAFYPTSLTDTWARILSYSAFFGPNPGLTSTVSNFTNMPGYLSFSRPYPIITAIGVEEKSKACGLPPQNSSQYEITPHEFGSWEDGIGNFIQSKYMGTSMSKGKPTGQCTTGFDNAGWCAALSSSTFNQQCGGTRNGINSFLGPGFGAPFVGLLGASQSSDLGLMPNPFQNLATAPRVSSLNNLILVDGGETIQVPPLWPFLYRPEIDTVVISDNSADSPANYQKNVSKPQLINLPSGQQIYHTLQQSINNNISYRMPYIPPPATFMANNFNKRPMTFFGCTLSPTSPAMFLIYLPNRPVVFDSNIQATVTQYNESTTAGMIANGEAIATNNGDPQFATCLACGIMKRSAAKANATLPAGCLNCFKTYCSNGYN